MEMQVLGRRAPKAKPTQRPLRRHVSVNTGAHLTLCRPWLSASSPPAVVLGQPVPGGTFAKQIIHWQACCDLLELHRALGSCMILPSMYRSAASGGCVAALKVLGVRAGYVPAEAPGALSYYSPRISYAQSAEALGLERNSLRNPVRCPTPMTGFSTYSC